MKADVETFEGKCGHVEAGTPDDAECQAEDTPLEARRSDYISKAKTYNSEVRAALEARVDALKAAIKRDQQAIRNLGAGRNAANHDPAVGDLVRQLSSLQIKAEKTAYDIKIHTDAPAKR